MVLRTRETPLTSALGATLASRHPTGIGDSEIGLGWAIMKKGSDELIWHDGGTGGYATFIGFIGFLAKAKVGVVILSNTSSDVDIGLHLISTFKYPLLLCQGSYAELGNSTLRL